MDGRWRAVLRRDAAFDGRFVFAVTTTGVYCRPSCPARRPRPGHARFFDGPEAAEREGFRACRRCQGRPDDRLLLACELLSRLPPREVPARLGWGPEQFARVFREALGVTPAEYARHLRDERFRRRAGADGLAAAAADFASSSRLYERAAERFGMTPGTLAARGRGARIAYDVFRSRIGRILIAATARGICAVLPAGSTSDLRSLFPKAELRRSRALLRFAAGRLRALVDGRIADARLPLDVRATAFQARVWASLRAIPAGETRSYAALARAIGRPRAVRAVGRAIAANAVAVLVPCHRAIGSDGSLTGFRWGLPRKRALLRAEATRSR
ncbi:MAG TPA: methylated-DNA--[protein]-cysteine S-methyltransferase [Planctomycetota bacterium]|nr:methylated-DNA--[protein]-cysteine S-methyltransferase [Planctomycetota bacterium]